MRIRSSGHASSMVLIVLVIFYILLIGIIILFFQQIILTMYKSNPFTNIMIFGIIIILPVGLLVAIIYSLIRLLRERAMKKSGARFKTRLILFFSFIALLAAVPQTTLSVTFINSVINSEFVSRLNEVVNNAWSIAVDYYTGKSRNLETFGKSSLLPYILRELPYNPEQTWLTLHNANPEIQFLQVFGPDNREILFKASNPVADAARISDFSGFSGQLGKLPKDGTLRK
jgi:nitrogen fixation/metabolism regulation signal transduction histidine kinase